MSFAGSAAMPLVQYEISPFQDFILRVSPFVHLVFVVFGLQISQQPGNEHCNSYLHYTEDWKKTTRFPSMKKAESIPVPDCLFVGLGQKMHCQKFDPGGVLGVKDPPK